MSRSTSIGHDEDHDDDLDDDLDEPIGDAVSHPNAVKIISTNNGNPYRMTKSFSGLPSISTGVTEMYNGPFIGRARALVDYTPSPYDRDALRFGVSEINIFEKYKNR